MMKDKLLYILLVIMLVGIFASSAQAWVGPLTVFNGVGGPRIAEGTGSKLHVVSAVDWRICYRELDTNMSWGQPQQLNNFFSYRPAIETDAQGRPHIVYPGDPNENPAELYHAYRDSSGVWHTTKITNTSSGEDVPVMARDSTGKLHLIYTRGDHTVMYMTWNGAWSSPTDIGWIGNPYYQRPDLSIDANDNLHVVWGDDGHVYYRKFNGTSWGSTLTIGNTLDFCAYPKIAAASPNNIVAITFDQYNGGSLKYVYSNNGGASWSGPTMQHLAYGHWPNIDNDENGYAHAAFHVSNGTGYMKWNGYSWTPQEQASYGDAWQGWCDILADSQGIAHIVFEYHRADATTSYVANYPDTTPPGQVTNFTASPSDGQVSLQWHNPSDMDFKNTMIRYRTDRFPQSPTDGAQVCVKATQPGSTDSYIHTQLQNGVTYYYAAFTCDTVSNYSSAVQASATPQALTCFGVKLLADGTIVGMQGKVVTAVFSDENCIYVEDPQRTAGIRVVDSGSGLSLGDIVNVSGTMSTYKPNGSTAAERQIADATVTRISSGTPLKPLAMNCLAVGGGPVGDLVPGVTEYTGEDGVGLNNIGMLVKIAGKVTQIISTYIYVDDGSDIDDISGRKGVFIYYPGTPPVSVGDQVSITGIVKGNIPTGWTTNRRFIKMRTTADLVKY